MADGVFFDGRSAKRHDAWVAIIGAEVVVQDEAGNVLARWPIAEIVMPRAASGDNELHLRITDDEAVLILSNPSMATRLNKLAPGRTGLRRLADMWLRVGVVLLVLILVGALIYYALPKAAKPVAALVPIEWEKAFGESVVSAIPGADRVCREVDGNDALQRLTERLARVIPLPYPIHVKIARLEMNNAFAAPGGFIVIGDKLVAEMTSADELAGVLAHEMGHISERHPMSRAVHIMGLSLLFEMLTSGSSGAADTIVQGAGLFLMLSHSRDDEREADRIATEALEAADISTEGLWKFFDRLESKYATSEAGGAAAMMRWLSTHPSFAERRSNVTLKPSTKSRPAMSASDWTSIQNICAV